MYIKSECREWSESYLRLEGARIRQWIEDAIYLDDTSDDRPHWDVFIEEFEFRLDHGIKFDSMLEDHLDTMPASMTIGFMDDIQNHFELIVDDVMEEYESQKAMNGEIERGYWRDVV